MKCPYCQKEAKWIPNEQVYGLRFGKSYMCWYCFEDDAYVGCHENSKRPLGTMANKELRKWRMEAHKVIDPLWKSKKFSRAKVYKTLKDVFGYEVHVGESDIETCKEIINSIQILLGERLL